MHITTSQVYFLDGAYFLDSNPDVFSVILDYLRYKTLVISPGLAIEAVKVSTVHSSLTAIVDGLLLVERWNS
jgi:hypothetical protein